MADTKPATPKPSVPKTSMGAPWLLGLVGGLLGLGVMVGLILAQGNKNKTTNKTNTTNTGNSSVTLNDNLNTTVNAAVNENTNTSPAGALTVSWQDPQKTDSLHIFTAPKSAQDFNPEGSTEYYLNGTVTAGDYAGASIYLIAYSPDYPSFYPIYFRILKQGSTLTVLNQSSDTTFKLENLPAQNIVTDTTHYLPGLQYPDSLSGPEPRQTLVREKGVNAFFTSTGLTTVFTDSTYGPVYTKVGENPIAELARQNVVTESNGFYLKAPDGTVRVYALNPDILERDTSNPDNPIAYTLVGKAKITWNDGQANSDKFTFTLQGGCGPQNFAQVVTGKFSLTTDLKKTGTSAQGDSVYELVDTNSQTLHEYYDNTYQSFGAPKVPFSEFVQNHPIIFWVDPFQRLIELSNQRYALQAECGKPVIYLYPTHTQTVHVDLQPQGGFTKSVPAYNGGWNVIARPDGTLINQADGATYPYLFWEGRGGIYHTPEPGFVVAQNNVHGFLKESLGQLGLNGKETNDFIDFWEPRMQGSPYYFVTFAGRAIMDQLAPLTITPKPDTTIRILMDFQPLQKPIATTPLHLTAPARRGFTVVEWGGVIR